jgi:hypothetical protein
LLAPEEKDWLAATMRLKIYKRSQEAKRGTDPLPTLCHTEQRRRRRRRRRKEQEEEAGPSGIVTKLAGEDEFPGEKDNKPRRKFYSQEEDQNILTYIIKNYIQQENKLLRPKGDSIWKEMVEHNVCPGRTWQSMRQHFKTKIVMKLEDYNLTESEKKKSAQLSSAKFLTPGTKVFLTGHSFLT